MIVCTMKAISVLSATSGIGQGSEQAQKHVDPHLHLYLAILIEAMRNYINTRYEQGLIFLSTYHHVSVKLWLGV